MSTWNSTYVITLLIVYSNIYYRCHCTRHADAIIKHVQRVGQLSTTVRASDNEMVTSVGFKGGTQISMGYNWHADPIRQDGALHSNVDESQL